MQSATPLLTTWPLDLFFCMSICLPIALGFNDYRDTQPHEARFGGVCKSCNLGTVSHSSSVFSRLFPWGLQHHSRLARCSCRHSSVTIYTHRLSRGSLGGLAELCISSQRISGIPAWWTIAIRFSALKEMKAVNSIPSASEMKTKNFLQREVSRSKPRQGAQRQPEPYQARWILCSKGL